MPWPLSSRGSVGGASSSRVAVLPIWRCICCTPCGPCGAGAATGAAGARAGSAVLAASCSLEAAMLLHLRLEMAGEQPPPKIVVLPLLGQPDEPAAQLEAGVAAHLETGKPDPGHRP